MLERLVIKKGAFLDVSGSAEVGGHGEAPRRRLLLCGCGEAHASEASPAFCLAALAAACLHAASPFPLHGSLFPPSLAGLPGQQPHACHTLHTR